MNHISKIIRELNPQPHILFNYQTDQTKIRFGIAFGLFSTVFGSFSDNLAEEGGGHVVVVILVVVVVAAVIVIVFSRGSLQIEPIEMVD